MIQITLPIYYTQEFKTKDNKTFLVGMNWYRNAHHHITNKVKKHYHELVAKALENNDTKVPNKYILGIRIFYKNPNSDGSNIASLMEKFILDAIQECGIVQDDSFKFHIGTDWVAGTLDKENPRAEIIIQPQ